MIRHERRMWTEVTKRRVAAAQKFRCAACQALLGPVWAADHRVPLHRGGSNAIENCQILCVECHAQKTQMELVCAAANRRENRLGTSKYWDPQSEFFIPQRPSPLVDRLRLRLAQPQQEKDAEQGRE